MQLASQHCSGIAGGIVGGRPTFKIVPGSRDPALQASAPSQLQARHNRSVDGPNLLQSRLKEFGFSTHGNIILE